MLGEFFAARPDEIDDDVVARGPSQRFEIVEAKTVSTVSISTLGEILGAGSYDELYERVDAGPRIESHEAGIDVIPDDVRDRLADVDVDAIAERWWATDEMRDWDPADVRDVVEKLAALAREARTTRRGLWFWWSL